MIAKRSALLFVLLLATAFAVSCASTPERATVVLPTATSTDAVTTASPSPVPSATATPAPTATSTPVYPRPEFIYNADCGNVDRATLPLADVTITSGSITAYAVVEVASQPSQRQQGLMCRSVFPDGTGMLFTWPTEHTGGFWMFNTYAPLDIIYFGGSGKPVMKPMSPCPRDNNEDDDTWRGRCIAEASPYGTTVPYLNALELPQGWLRAQGINTDAPGDFVVSFALRD